MMSFGHNGLMAPLVWFWSLHIHCHYNDVIMGAIASPITSVTIVYSAVYSGRDQRKHQSSASLAFVLGIHRWLVNSPHKGPVMRKIFPFDGAIMEREAYVHLILIRVFFSFSFFFCLVLKGYSRSSTTNGSLWRTELSSYPGYFWKLHWKFMGPRKYPG